jgi:hypothetical protein
VVAATSVRVAASMTVTATPSAGAPTLVVTCPAIPAVACRAWVSPGEAHTTASTVPTTIIHRFPNPRAMASALVVSYVDTTSDQPVG